MSITSRLPNKDSNAISTQLQSHLKNYQTRRFEVNKIFDISVVHSDADRAMKILIDRFPGVKIDIGAPNGHAERADERIRRVKKICKQVIVSLPWKLPNFLLDDLVKYATIRLNMMLGHERIVSAKVDFGGMKARLDKEYGLGFGEYCLVHDRAAQSNYIFQARAKSGIALWPEFNSHGSWVLYCLETESHLSSANWDSLPTSQVYN